MIIALHITRIDKKKISKINYLIEAIKINHNFQIICNHKYDEINAFKINRDEELLDYSTYLFALKYCGENYLDCLCINDTFFENKLFYKYRVDKLLEKIQKIKNGQSIIGHLMFYKGRKYIPTYVFYINYKAICILLENKTIQILSNNKEKSFDIKLDDNEFNSIMKMNKNIYSIHPLSGVKWHNNNFVKSSVRRSKLICSALEQYISNILDENNTLFIDIFKNVLIGNTVYRVENKISTIKYKIKKCRLLEK